MATFNVTTLVDENDAGATEATPGGAGLSLREALALANADGGTADTIVFDASLSGGTTAEVDDGVMTLGGAELVINSAVTIDGDVNGDGKADITLDANSLSRVIGVTGGASTLRALTITDGEASAGFGGGVLVELGAALTIVNSTVTGNEAPGGFGGGISNAGLLTLNNVLVSANTANGGFGGGLNNGGTAHLTNTTFDANTATGAFGGGINNAGTLTLTNVTMTGNSASFGGALYNVDTLTLTNSILAGNAGAFGADLNLSGGTTTFSGHNVFSQAGVGDAEDTAGAAITDIFHETGTNSVGVDSGLLADNGGPTQTVAIKAGGIAHDAANVVLPVDTTDADGDSNTAENLTIDARGLARQVGATVDVGALELQATPTDLTVTTLSDSTTNDYGGGDYVLETADGGGLSLREALALANADPDANTIVFDASLTGGNTPGVDDGFIELGGTELVLSTDVTIDGDVDGDGDADIAVSGDDASRVFRVDDGGISSISATLNGLVIRDGAGDRGGGIAVGPDEILTISNSTVSDNAASVEGGGIYQATRAQLTLIGTTVSGNNSAGDGGGIFAEIGTNSAVTLINSTVSGNTAGADGGGIYADNNIPVTLTNTTVFGNVAADSGGGIYARLNNLFTVTNSTVTGNSAGTSGGGIYSDGSGGLTTLTNSIVAGNSAALADDFFGSSFATFANLEFTGANIIGSAPVNFGTVTGQADHATVIDGADQAALETVFAEVALIDPDGAGSGNPAFYAGVLADNGGPVETIALNPDLANPAIDSGDPDLLDETQATVPDLNGDGDQNDTITTDARGFDRNVDFDGGGAAPDLGAFEAQLAASFEVTTLDDELDSNDPNATLADFGGANDLSLREALTLANQDPTTADTITFDDALIAGGPGADGVITLALAQGELVIDGDVTIDGDVNGDDAPDITISGAVSDSAVLHVYNGTVALNGLTIRDGFADYGAGVTVGTYCGCNTADVTLSNSVVRNNDAEYGGGIYVALGSSLRLVDSVVQENYAEFAGGGIYNAGTLTVINSTLSDNITGDVGGGIYNFEGAVAVLNSTLSGNFAGNAGGGITTGGGTLSLTNTTLHGNLAISAGGGIASADSTVSVTNSTLTGNFASYGGGIATGGDDFTITNSIVAGNDDSLTPGTADIAVVLGSAPVYTGHNVLSEGTAGANVTIEANLANIFAALETIDLIPGPGDEFQAGALANNGGPVRTVLILRGGAASDEGNSAFLNEAALGIDVNGDGDQTDAIDTDARGLTRVVGGTVDIGAVELQDGVARNDAFATLENVVVSVAVSVFANNGSGADTGDQLVVTQANGQSTNVGLQITLASGALVTVNGNGTFSYNPNGAFSFLPGVGSGASNITATDTFQYTLPGGSTATVTVTVTGLSFNDDNLRGTGGNDSLTGGLGNDTYFVENAGDAVHESAGQGTLDRVLASVSYVLAAAVNVELISTANSLGTGAINLTGNELANSIYGNAGTNVLGGGGGNDILSGLAGNDELNGGAADDKLYGGAGQNDLAGGAGNDWYIIDSATDVIVEGAVEGTLDRVFASVSYALTAGAHVEFMSTTTISTAAINLTGNELANTISGNDNVNVLAGGAGDDVLNGFGGIDTLNGGNGDDLLSGGADGDTLNGNADADRLLGEAGNDTLNGGEGDDTMFGGAGDDAINGGAGADRLEGGTGQNDLIGSIGDDVYIITSATDTIVESAGQGTLDRAYTSVSYALAATAQVEYLATLDTAGASPVALTGSAIANSIYGNNGANVISGKGGNDILSGRGGGDTFVFDTLPHGTANHDTITDFNGVQDSLRLAKSVFTALTGNAGARLSADQFVVGPSAQDANDRIIYHNGTLSYDSNGNAAGGVTLIAFLTGRPTLSNADIILG